MKIIVLLVVVSSIAPSIASSNLKQSMVDFASALAAAGAACDDQQLSKFFKGAIQCHHDLADRHQSSEERVREQLMAAMTKGLEEDDDDDGGLGILGMASKIQMDDLCQSFTMAVDCVNNLDSACGDELKETLVRLYLGFVVGEIRQGIFKMTLGRDCDVIRKLVVRDGLEKYSYQEDQGDEATHLFEEIKIPLRM